MSLLWMDYEAEFDNLVDTSNQYEMEDNPEYFAKLTKRIKKIVYRDTRYNVDFLYTAYVLKDEKIIEDYAVWLYQLMASVLKDRTRIQSMEYVIKHLNYIKKSLGADSQPGQNIKPPASDRMCAEQYPGTGSGR